MCLVGGGGGAEEDDEAWIGVWERGACDATRRAQLAESVGGAVLRLGQDRTLPLAYPTLPYPTSLAGD